MHTIQKLSSVLVETASSTLGVHHSCAAWEDRFKKAVKESTGNGLCDIALSSYSFTDLCLLVLVCQLSVQCLCHDIAFDFPPQPMGCVCSLTVHAADQSRCVRR